MSQKELVGRKNVIYRAFCELKELLLSYPVLRNVNFSLPFTLQVDEAFKINLNLELKSIINIELVVATYRAQ